MALTLGLEFKTYKMGFGVGRDGARTITFPFRVPQLNGGVCIIAASSLLAPAGVTKGMGATHPPDAFYIYTSFS